MPKSKTKSAEQKRKETRDRIVKLREDAVYREQEQAANTSSHRIARQDATRRKQEQTANTSSHRIARQDATRREQEQTADTSSRRIARQDATRREQEQAANTSSRRIARQDATRREQEQAADTSSRRIARQDATRREQEQAANTSSRRISRQDPNVRTPEKNRDAASRRCVRTTPKRKSTEQIANTEAKRKRRKLFETVYDRNLRKYRATIQESPSIICSCCGRLWYEKSTVATSEQALRASNCKDEFINTILNVHQQQHRLCSTCKKYVSKQKVPKLCLSNGLDFPEIPEPLQDLSPLEERLVALRLPFMQIRAIGSERQKLLKGNVVNVENDLNVSAKILPRNFNETSTVQVQMMRRMNYKSPYMYETIRPQKVYNAAKFLVGTELYAAENVLLSEDWRYNHEGASINFICDDNEDESENTHNTETDNEEDEERQNLVTMGADETFIYRENDGSLGIRIAPGEGKTPIPLYLDLNAEALSFPSIFGGQKTQLNEKVKLSVTDLAKSRLQRYDRRACRPDFLFWTFKKSYNEKVRQAVQVCMRKKVGRVTAADIRVPGYIDHLLQNDDGYAVFKNLRSSPAYWKAKAKKVIAMVRQLGNCSFFITLSAAETKWTELLVILMKILKQRDITEEEAKGLDFEEIADLIRNDPVTCMQHFDHRYRALLSLILKPEGGIFSPYKFQDYFSRLEFQMRGSPHSHGLYWIKDAPMYVNDDYTSEKDCITFIDKFITCERCEEGEMKDLIGYQIHKHSRSCEKKRKHGIKCRFGFPKPPMEETRILQPLPKDLNPNERKEAVELYSQIQQKLNEYGRSFKEDLDYDELLDELGTTHMDYIFAIRSSIKRTTVFLKRSTSSIFVNGYNRKLLEAWRANIDIQFVLDTYACAKYCVGYILKSEGGLSKLLQAATQEARRGNTQVQDKLKKFANILITGSEISAQEAAAFLLGIHNTSCSKTDLFINTSIPDERVGFLKSQKELQDLADDSEDICAKGLIDHYTQRPEELEEICLAEFASMYEFTKSKSIAIPNVDHSENEEEEEGEEIPLSQIALPKNCMQLKDKSGSVRKRGNRKIIRYRHYGKNEDPHNYYREQLMLFHPWRNESTELIDINPILEAEQYKVEIMENSQPFYADRLIDEEVLCNLVNELEADSVEDQDNEDNDMVHNDMEIRDIELHPEDVFEEIPTAGSRVEQFLIPRLIQEPEYQKTMRTLNDKQRRFVLNVLYQLKTSSSPFYYFLSGGAGVGKSHSIMAIVQSYLRFSSKAPTITPDQICVLVAAPTGKAAFNVFGMTLHCLFKLPPNQFGGKLGDLESSTLNTLRMKLAKVKLFIIDEISMVSNRQLYDINQRMCQIFASSMDFGGRSIIVVGHLRQLPPVAAPHVFKPPKHLPLGECVGNHLWEKFQFYELDEIMRQRGELEFCKALNNMSEGCMDAEDIALIRSREVNSTNVPPKNAVYLFATNKECQEHNNSIHAELGTEGAVSVAFDKVQGSGPDSQKRNLLEFAATLTPQQSDGLPYKTNLQVDAIYFISTNVDVQDGLFNGSTGTLKKIEYGFNAKNERLPRRAWLDFPHPLVGAIKKASTRAYQQQKQINLDWVSVDRITRNLSKTGRNQGLELIRTQIPLVAANGMTITKSQGSSLPFVVVCVKQGPLRRRKLTRELLYVACSRATSLMGLFIDGEFCPPSLPPPDDAVTLEVERLKTFPVKFQIRFLQDFDQTYEKIYFHNVQSFHAHHLDVTADQCAMASDVMAFVEPHLIKEDQFFIPGFNCIHRSDCTKSRSSSEGAILFSKDQASIDPNSVITTHDICSTGNCILVQWKQSDVTLVMIYKSPTYSQSTFLRKLAQVLRPINGKVIVFGDFNINFMNEDGRKLLELIGDFNLESKLPNTSPSTEGGTQIDCCFSNIPNMLAWYYESYYSYHKPICFVYAKHE